MYKIHIIYAQFIQLLFRKNSYCGCHGTTLPPIFIARLMAGHSATWTQTGGLSDADFDGSGGEDGGDEGGDIDAGAGDGAPRVYLNRTLEGKNQVAQVPDAPTNIQMAYDKDTKRATFTWDKMYTKSGSKAIYNTYIRRLDDISRNVSGTLMRVPADIATGKLKAYTEWSSFLPAETCFFDNLEDGTYEMGVQSVAYNYGASEFTPSLFKIDNGVVTGVDEIAAEDNTCNAPVEYYNLQGVRVEIPSAPGVYIVKKGNKVSKTIIS